MLSPLQYLLISLQTSQMILIGLGKPNPTSLSCFDMKMFGKGENRDFHPEGQKRSCFLLPTTSALPAHFFGSLWHHETKVWLSESPRFNLFVFLDSIYGLKSLWICLYFLSYGLIYLISLSSSTCGSYTHTKDNITNIPTLYKI